MRPTMHHRPLKYLLQRQLHRCRSRPRVAGANDLKLRGGIAWLGRNAAHLVGLHVTSAWIISLKWPIFSGCETNEERYNDLTKALQVQKRVFISRQQCCADRGDTKRVFGQAREKSRLESGASWDVGHICVLALQAWEFENQRRNVIDLFVGGPPRLTSKHRSCRFPVRIIMCKRFEEQLRPLFHLRHSILEWISRHDTSSYH